MYGAMKLAGAVVLVTGGAVRIGKAICEAFASKGADVVVHYRRSVRAARTLCDGLQGKGVRAWAQEADLRDPAACDRLVAGAVERAGRLDILVNNAAVFEPDEVRTFDPAAAWEQWRTNLVAPICLTRSFAQRTRRGKVVNLLDRRVRGHDTSHLSYLLGKKALEEFTALSALELAPGIAVNAVAPGAVLPPPGRKGLPGGPVPLRRRCLPRDVADAVVFCTENDALTGQVLFIDGGQHLLGQAAD